MKKKQILPLLILIVLLAVLIASYVALSAYNGKNAAEEGSETAETAEEIAVSQFLAADVTAISYKTAEVDVSLVKSGSVWVFDGDEKYPVDQSAVAKMVSAVASLSAGRKLDGGDASVYGLDKPSLTVTVTALGTEHVFFLGDLNTYNDMTYLGYGDSVYMISDTLTDIFDADKDELFGAADSFPSAISRESVTKITVTNKKGDFADVSDADGIESAVFDAQKYLSFAILKGYGLDSTALGDYGIGEDSARVVIEYTYNGAKASFEALLGKAEDGNCYYTVPGSTTVYGIDTAGYDTITAYAYYTPAEETK